MRLAGIQAAVTGGASGLGRATARCLVDRGAAVTIIDLPGSDGGRVAKELGHDTVFAPADVTDEQQLAGALDVASGRNGLRALVHCAGGSGGRRPRVLDEDGQPGSLADFQWVVQLNLVGTFNAVRLAAERMASGEVVDGERGAMVLTSSVAAYEGQIGLIAYASAKAGIVGMTLNAARDLASRAIRVCTIAPGMMDTPLIGRLPADLVESLHRTVPSPPRFGRPDEFGQLAATILENGYLNGETIRLDGAVRLPPS